MKMVALLCFFSLCILYALILLLFLQLTFLLAFTFSTQPLMTRVRRFNARKDCLVCIVGVIAGGHYDQGRDSECKAYNYYFYIQQFCQCLWSAWLHINTDFNDDDCHYDWDLLMTIILQGLLPSLLSVLSPLQGLWSWLRCQPNVDDNNEIGNVHGLIKLDEWVYCVDYVD